jgi:AbrB family looped-hinge helix DNA binding protein
MALYTSSISPKGQITLPKEFRSRLKLHTKDKVTIRLENERIVVTPAEDELAAGFRSIPALKRPMTDNEMTELATEENAREVVRRLSR